MSSAELIETRTVAQEGAADMTREQIVEWLDTWDEALLQQLYNRAYKVKLAEVSNQVYFRGIVEFSNICIKNCYYCGIRRDNKRIERFQMSHEEILESAAWAQEAEYGSIVLQSGERHDEAFVDFVEDVLHGIHKQSNGELGVTLSLGEQSAETLHRWFAAGAHRYLLRIETSNPELYRRLHPDDHRFEARLACIDTLRQVGYQVGTGVMIGLLGQTSQDLADDLLFFRDMDIDMIGMGPYILHADTPMSEGVDLFNSERQITLGLKMIALARLLLRDVNIAATTALQALNPVGRELGLKAGANIIMPNITHTKYRALYQLYDNKPCMDENAKMCRRCLDSRVESIGETIGYKQWGDSPHYFKRTGKPWS